MTSVLSAGKRRKPKAANAKSETHHRRELLPGRLSPGGPGIPDPPLCHERWNSICPRVYALRSGAALDCGETRAKCFDARCPDGGRAILRGEAVEDDGLPNIRKTARHGGPCRAVLFSHTRIHEKQDNRLVLIAPTARWILRKRTAARRNRKAVSSVDIILMGG